MLVSLLPFTRERTLKTSANALHGPGEGPGTFRRHRQTQTFADVEGIAVVCNKLPSNSSEPRQQLFTDRVDECHLRQVHDKSRRNVEARQQISCILGERPNEKMVRYTTRGHRAFITLDVLNSTWFFNAPWVATGELGRRIRATNWAYLGELCCAKVSWSLMTFMRRRRS